MGNNACKECAAWVDDERNPKCGFCHLHPPMGIAYVASSGDLVCSFPHVDGASFCLDFRKKEEKERSYLPALEMDKKGGKITR
ncbi:MAG: hypothetical protein WC291_12180 [Thermodesulfovibrionales bacterium]|jgi:hypothetical protein